MIDGGHRASNDHTFWLCLIVMVHTEPLQVDVPLCPLPIRRNGAVDRQLYGLHVSHGLSYKHT